VQRVLHLQNEQLAHTVAAPATAAARSAFCNYSPRYPHIWWFSLLSLSLSHPSSSLAPSHGRGRAERRRGARSARGWRSPRRKTCCSLSIASTSPPSGETPPPRPRPHLVSPRHAAQRIRKEELAPAPPPAELHLRRVPFLNGPRLEVARDPTPDAAGEDEHGRSTPPSPAVLAMESSSIRHGGLAVFVDPPRGLLSRPAAVEASSSIRRGALKSREVEPEVSMRRQRPSPEDNNNPPEGALPGCLLRSCTASSPSSTSPPLIQARGLLSAVVGVDS
jgi:hypothetical protein